jgi:hypothetical protein
MGPPRDRHDLPSVITRRTDDDLVQAAQSGDPQGLC